MDATVVDDIGLHHLVAVGLHDFGQAEAQQVVAHVSQVQRLVGVGRGVLDHHQLAVVGGGSKAIIGRLGDMLEHAGPVGGLDGDIQEALNDVELLHDVAVGQHVLANLLRRHVGRLVRRLQEGEYHNRLVALKFLLGRLGNDLFGGKFHAIQLLDRCSGGLSQNSINRHHLYFKLLVIILYFLVFSGGLDRVNHDKLVDGCSAIVPAIIVGAKVAVQSGWNLLAIHILHIPSDG